MLWVVSKSPQWLEVFMSQGKRTHNLTLFGSIVCDSKGLHFFRFRWSVKWYCPIGWYVIVSILLWTRYPLLPMTIWGRYSWMPVFPWCPIFRKSWSVVLQILDTQTGTVSLLTMHNAKADVRLMSMKCAWVWVCNVTDSQITQNKNKFIQEKLNHKFWTQISLIWEPVEWYDSKS